MPTTELDPELVQWVDLLRSPLLDDHLVAIKTLQHLGDEDAIAPLIDALQDCCDTRTPIFGSGGGAQIADELSVPLWGQVPIDPGLSEAGGKALAADSLFRGIFDLIAQGLNGTFGE